MSAATFRLADVAPRLARARDQWIAHKREADRVELARACKLHELQRVVAHRELQLVRAYRTRNSRYIAERQRKLTSAQNRLAAVERTAA